MKLEDLRDAVDDLLSKSDDELTEAMESVKRNRVEMKIEPKCDIQNLMIQAAKDIQVSGITFGFWVANSYLRRIAERAIELNDKDLLYNLKQLCLIKEVEEKNGD